MREIVQAIGLIVTGGFAIACGFLAYRVISGNKIEYDRNRRRSGSLLRTLLGKLPSSFDGTRDSRVSAGIAVDREKNEWVEQGRLSDEAVAAALRRPQ
jgi:hypothetical protein